VPTYEVGRRAGLGEEVTAADLAALAPAWPDPATAAAGTTATLPVYLAWEFTTGDGGDFEARVRALQMAPAPEMRKSGKRKSADRNPIISACSPRPLRLLVISLGTRTDEVWEN